MFYTPEEYQKFTEMLDAFREYLDDTYLFEIIYSSKMGYLWVDVVSFESSFYRLASARELLENLCWCIYCDVIHDHTEHEYIEWETRKRINSYMKHLPDCVKMPKIFW